MEKKIRYMNIGVTNRCNLKCFMCDIWKERPKRDLSVGIVKKLLESRCLDDKLDITLTGGEPFLHKGLWQITEEIFMRNRCWLKGISTNGTLTKEVLRYFHDFLGRLPCDFSLHISMDGINCHDSQRGQSINKVLDTVGAVKKAYPSVSIKIKFTITSVNYMDIIPTFRFCRENGLDFRVKLAEYAKHYTNRMDQRDFLFGNAARKSIVRDLLQVSQEKYRLRDENAAFITATVRFLQGEPRRDVCAAPFQRVFLMPNGDIFSCLHFPKIGNLCNKSLDQIWVSSTAEKHRNTVRQEGCSGCISYHGA